MTSVFLPSSWILATLENLVINPSADIVDGPFGSNLKASEYKDKGIPIIRLQNIDRNRFIDKNIKFISEEKAEELQRHSFIAGDIAITKLGDPLGKATIVPDKYKRGIIVADIVRARIEPMYADKKFVTYAINSPSVVKSLESEVKGTTRPRVNLGHIRELQIPLAPLNEQKRIADKLDSLLARVDKCQEHLDRVPQILKRFRQSVLAAATSGKLTEEWRLKNKKSEGWQSTYVSDVCDVIRGASPRPAGDLRFFGGDGVIPWITVGEITKDTHKYLNSVSTFLTEEGKNQSRYIEPGTLLLTNSGATLGVPKITKIGGCINDGSVALLGLEEPLKSYLYYVLLSKTESLRQIKHGATQPNLNTSIVKAIEFSMPSVDEQHEVINSIEKLFGLADCIETRWSTVQKRVSQLPLSLLAKAFRGELVEQYPNDEPAVELLERIKIARENAQKAPKKPRRRADMTAEKTEKDDTRLGIIRALEKSGKELSAQELFQFAGYPMDAESELVEEFFVEVRDALENRQISKKRHNDTDWFSLLSK